jgi:hypothetical protein
MYHVLTKSFVLLFFMFVVENTVFAASLQWKPIVLDFTSNQTIKWFDFPLKVTFTHQGSGKKIILDGYWDGGKSWKVRFAPTQKGTWNWQSTSSDRGLNNKRGDIIAMSPDNSDKRNNPNLHGHLKVSKDHRRLNYADGTPFFWMGDTNWAIISDRCGVNNNNFYSYVRNRKNNEFNLIQVQYFQKDQYNEGGYPFKGNTGKGPGSGRWQGINPNYFRNVDTRIEHLFNQGFVVAGHPSWISSTKISLPWAKRIMQYLMARYGAYNTVWSLTGEYQFSRKNSNSLRSPRGWQQLGRFVQQNNPYDHPITIHPTYGAPNYIKGKRFKDYSSSGEFHKASWLDINWIQTYAFVEDVSESVFADYNKRPVKPVIMAEPGYEFYLSGSYGKQRYKVIDGNLSRLQAWSSILNGAAGHTYGAWGVWQFYTPTHPQPGTNSKNAKPWSTRLDAEGASNMKHLRSFFTSSNFRWTALTPRRNWLRVNGKTPKWPSRNDFSPPHLAVSPGKTYVVYIPSGNRRKAITVTHLNNNPYRARWYNPRNGQYRTINNPPNGVNQWKIPALPDNNDWVLLLTVENYI